MWLNSLDVGPATQGWGGQVLDDQEQRLWDAVRAQVPQWPLFTRLRLSVERKVAREQLRAKS